MQSRKASAVEAVANVSIGYAVSVAANIAVLPMFGMHASLAESAAIGMIFTAISLVRSYALRRIFNAWHPKN